MTPRPLPSAPMMMGWGSVPPHAPAEDPEISSTNLQRLGEQVGGLLGGDGAALDECLQRRTLDPLGGDEGHAIDRIAPAANDRAHGGMVDAGEPLHRDVVVRLLLVTQAATIHPEREKPPHGDELVVFVSKARKTTPEASWVNMSSI